MSQSWSPIEPYKGAHIRVKFHDFFHHGIYISHDCVVQFGLPMDVYSEPEKVKVLVSSLEEFCKDESIFEVRVYSKDELLRKRSDEEIGDYALSCVGMGGYNLLNNNCEHFANLCVFGKKISAQVESVYKDVEMLLAKLKK